MIGAGKQRRPAVAVLGEHRVASAAADLARHVRALGGFDADMVVVPRTDVDVATQVERLPERYHAVYLVQVHPLQAHEAGERAAEHDLRLVVSDHDGAAAALCAAVLVHLRDTGRPAERARVAIAGGAHLPALAPLLMISGVYDLLMWNDPDAAVLPWDRAVRDADVAIDLRPGPAAAAEALRIAADRGDGSLLRPSDARWDQHVVAALLRLALACPPGAMHVGMSALRACAAGVVAATPRPGHGRPAGAAITDAVEAAVRRCIDPRLAVLGVTEDAEEV